MSSSSNPITNSTAISNNSININTPNSTYANITAPPELLLPIHNEVLVEILTNLKDPLYNKNSPSILNNIFKLASKLESSNLQPEQFRDFLTEIHDLFILFDSTKKATTLRVIRFCLLNGQFVKVMMAEEFHWIVILSFEKEPINENSVERMQAFKIMDSIRKVCPDHFPLAFGRSLVAIANSEKDNFRRLCIDLIRELALVNPCIVGTMYGFHVLLDSIIDPISQDLADRITHTILFLLNEPLTRKVVTACVDIKILLSPFTDLDTDPSELTTKWKAAKAAFSIMMKSWVGIYMLTSDELALPMLIGMLTDPKLPTVTLEVILEAISDVLDPLISKVRFYNKVNRRVSTTTYMTMNSNPTGTSPTKETTRTQRANSDSEISPSNTTNSPKNSNTQTLLLSASSTALNEMGNSSNQSKPTNKQNNYNNNNNIYRPLPAQPKANHRASFSLTDQFYNMTHSGSRSSFNKDNKDNNTSISDSIKSPTPESSRIGRSFIGGLLFGTRVPSPALSQNPQPKASKRSSKLISSASNNNLHDIMESSSKSGIAATSDSSNSKDTINARRRNSFNVASLKYEDKHSTLGEEIDPIINLLDNYSAIVICSFLHCNLIPALFALSTSGNTKISSFARKLLINFLIVLSGILPENLCAELLEDSTLIEMATMIKREDTYLMSNKAYKSSQLLLSLAETFSMMKLPKNTSGLHITTLSTMLSTSSTRNSLRTKQPSHRSSVTMLTPSHNSVTISATNANMLYQNGNVSGKGNNFTSLNIQNLFQLGEEVKISTLGRFSTNEFSYENNVIDVIKSLRRTLTSEIDKTEFVKQMEQSRVLGKDGKEPFKWDWPFIYDMLQYSFINSLRVKDALNTKWIKRLSGFYRCSIEDKGYYANLDWDPVNLPFYECLLTFLQVLSKDDNGIQFLKNETSGLILNGFLREIQSLVTFHKIANNSNTTNIFNSINSPNGSSSAPSGNSSINQKHLFRLFACQATMAREYFILLGKLVTVPRLQKLLEELNILNNLKQIFHYPTLFYLHRLVLTSFILTDKGTYSKQLIALYTTKASTTITNSNSTGQIPENSKSHQSNLFGSSSRNSISMAGRQSIRMSISGATSSPNGSINNLANLATNFIPPNSCLSTPSVQRDEMLIHIFSTIRTLIQLTLIKNGSLESYVKTNFASSMLFGPNLDDNSNASSSYLDETLWCVDIIINEINAIEAADIEVDYHNKDFGYGLTHPVIITNAYHMLLYQILNEIIHNRYYLYYILNTKKIHLNEEILSQHSILSRFCCLAEGVNYLHERQILDKLITDWIDNKTKDYVLYIEDQMANIFTMTAQSNDAPTPAALFNLTDITNSLSTTSLYDTIFHKEYSYLLNNNLCPISVKTPDLLDALTDGDCKISSNTTITSGSLLPPGEIDVEGLIRIPWNIEAKLTTSGGYASRDPSANSGEYLKLDTYLDISHISSPLNFQMTSDQNRIVRVRGIVLDARGRPYGKAIASHVTISSSLLVGTSAVLKDGRIQSNSASSNRRRSSATPQTKDSNIQGSNANSFNGSNPLNNPSYSDQYITPDIDSPITLGQEYLYEWFTCRPGNRQQGNVTAELEDGRILVSLPDEPIVFVFSKRPPSLAANSNVNTGSRKARAGSLLVPPTMITPDITMSNRPSSAKYPNSTRPSETPFEASRFSQRLDPTRASANTGYLYLIEIQYYFKLETGQALFAPMPRHLFGELAKTNEGINQLARRNVVADTINKAYLVYESLLKFSNSSINSLSSNTLPIPTPAVLSPISNASSTTSANNTSSSPNPSSASHSQQPLPATVNISQDLNLELRSALWSLGHIASTDSGYTAIIAVKPHFVEWCIQGACACPYFNLRGSFFFILGLIGRSSKGSLKLTQCNWNHTSLHSNSALSFPTKPKVLFKSYTQIGSQDSSSQSAGMRKTVNMLSKLNNATQGPTLPYLTGIMPPQSLKTLTPMMASGSISLEQEILNLIAKMPGAMLYRECKARLEYIKNEHPEVFMKRSLFVDVMKTFDAYNFRLTIRRDILNLFHEEARLKTPIQQIDVSSYNISSSASQSFSNFCPMISCEDDAPSLTLGH